MNKKILTKCKNSNIGQLSYGHYLCQLCNFKKKKNPGMGTPGFDQKI